MDGQRLAKWYLTRNGRKEFRRELRKQDSPKAIYGYRHNLQDPIEHTPTETLAIALIAGDNRAVEFAREQLPVFPLDNAIHVGESWCSGCHTWKPIALFTSDNSKASLTRCQCKDCRNEAERERRRREREGNPQPKWYNGWKGLFAGDTFEKALECPYCGTKRRQMKAGETRAGSQRYRCGVCDRNYTPAPKIHWITGVEKAKEPMPS